MERLAIVAAVVAFVCALGWAYGRWRSAAVSDDGAVPVLPARLRTSAERTWVVFTSPFCAACGPVTERLRAADPGAAVVTVDATAEPALAASFRIRLAPTVLLARPDGTVDARLVGAAAVEAHLSRGAGLGRPRRRKAPPW